MKKTLRISCLLFSLLLMTLLCACGYNEEFSEEVKTYRNNVHWGEGEKLVFYDKDKDQYHTKGLRREVAAGNAKEIGGVIEYSKDQNEPYQVIFRLMDPKYGIEIAKTSLRNLIMRYGEAGEWAEKEWAYGLDNREIRDMLRFNPENGGTKIAVYNEETELFGYDPDSIPAEICASSPGEIGLIACYKGSPNDSDTYLYDTTLYSQGPGAALLSVFKHNGYNVGSNVYAVWLMEQQQEYQYGRAFKGTEARMGGGNKLVAKEDGSLHYSKWKIPEDLLAGTPEEVAAVVRYTESPSVITLSICDVKNDFIFETVTLYSSTQKAVNASSVTVRFADTQVPTALRLLREEYLFDCHVKTLIENKQTGGKKLAVWDEDAGHYINFGHGTLSMKDDQIGGVLRLIPEEATVVVQGYSLFGLGGGTNVTVTRQQLVVEIRSNTSTLLKRATLTAPIPKRVAADTTRIYSEISEEQIAEWLEKNWKS